MRKHSGPIYEVTLRVDPAAAANLDDWLVAHVGEMLTLPGFVDAEIGRLDDSNGRPGRVVRYYVADDRHLDDYLAGPAERMRQQATDAFGAHAEATRRIVHDSGRPALLPASGEHCLNCDALLTGQYCGQCGQRARSRLISVWELLRDAFGDVLDVDSRLWRTLITLATRPGQLTRDYLQGRRARYMPPFRTYLVLSLVFFLVATFDPHEHFGLFFEPPADAPVTQEDKAAAAREVLDELAAEGITLPVKPRNDNDTGFDMDVDCSDFESDPSGSPPWAAALCQSIVSGEASNFMDRLRDSAPTGLIVLLPLMALVLKVLYPLSKRYYVEHLLLLVHYHAFVFLALIVQILLGGLGSLLHVPGLAMAAVLLVVPVYIPTYLYKALRRVYGQGHWLTSLKFVLLIFAYSVGMLVVLALLGVMAVVAG